MLINKQILSLVLVACIFFTGCQNKIEQLSINSKETFSIDILSPERGKLLGEDLVVIEQDTDSEKIDSLYAALLVNTNEQKLLVSKNAYERVYPASITMLATALTILENMDFNHYTTVYDLYIIMNHLMQNEEFMNIISHKSFDSIYKNEKGSVDKETYTSTILYLNGDREMPSGITVLGGKTGTTASAGCCLSLFLQDAKGKNYIAIGMKAADKDTLYSQMEILIQKILN